MGFIKIDKIKIHFLLIFVILFGCYTGDDVIGKVRIQYDGEWHAVITENQTENEYTGYGDIIYSFKNPKKLKITASKLDITDYKLTIYIYESGRITEGDSTRDPEGTVNAEYEFKY